jgi:hypothetical protein
MGLPTFYSLSSLFCDARAKPVRVAQKEEEWN